MSTSNAEDQGNSESVELPEPDADEGGGESSQGGESRSDASGGGERQTRKERRQGELHASQEAARIAREEAAQERRERERLSNEVAELRGRWEQSQQQQQRDVKDKYADKIAALEDEAQLILEKVSNTKDPEQQKALMKKWNEKNREAIRLDIQRENEKNERENTQQQQQQGMSPRDVAMWTALEADYPMIANKDRAGQRLRATADLYINKLISEGKPDNLATLRAACALAAKELKIGGHDASPSNGSRGAYGGHANGDGGGGRGDNGRPTVEWGPQQRAMAMAMANRLGKGYDEAEAKAEWMKRVAPGVARRMSEE